MPVEKKLKVRPSVKGRDGKEKGKEVSLIPEWCRYHGIESGDVVTMLADGIIIILPPNVTEEKELEVRRFLEGER